MNIYYVIRNTRTGSIVASTFDLHDARRLARELNARHQSNDHKVEAASAEG